MANTFEEIKDLKVIEVRDLTEAEEVAVAQAQKEKEVLN